MDLKPLFEAFAKQAVDAAAVQIVKTPEPAHIYVIRHPDGSLRTGEVQPSPRDHKCLSIDAITTYCAGWLGEPNESVPKEKLKKVVVWYSREAVVGILDDDTRRDKVTLPLRLSPQMTQLLELEKDEEAMNQGDYLRLLRIRLSGCSISDRFVEAVKRLRMSGQSTIDQGTRSIGKDLESQLEGSARFPETLVLNVPVFAGNVHPAPYSVTCAVEVDPAGLFQLIPLAGVLEQTLQRAEEDIGQRVRASLADKGADVPVFFGKL